MKNTVETLELTKVRLTVEVPFEEMKSEMDRAYKEIAGQVNIPGSRKGHVPPRIIGQRFDRVTVIEQAVNQVLPGYYSNAVNENDLCPMAQPTAGVIEIPNMTGPQGGQLIFTVEVDVIPAFELLEINKKPVIGVESTEATEEDVRKEFEDLRGYFATLKTINCKVKTDDFTTIDLVATIDGKQANPTPDVPYEIDSGSMFDGQDTVLCGTRTGEEVTFTSKLKGGEHKGEEAEAAITIRAMKTRKLPKANDSFTQTVSEFDTIDELKGDLKKQAARSKESRQALAVHDVLTDLLLDRAETVLPEPAVNHQVERRIGEDAKPKVKREVREVVEKEIRTKLFFEALAKKFDVQVFQQELIDYVIQMSQSFGIDINQLFSSFQQMVNVVAGLGCSEALAEALEVVATKDANGTDVGLSKFFGTDPAAERGTEVITEVTDKQE